MSLQELSILLKKLFEHSIGSSSITLGSINELIIDDLDVESIWEQLQCRNRPLRRFANKSTSRLAVSFRQNSVHSQEQKQSEGNESDSEVSVASVDGISEDGVVNDGIENDEEDEMEKWLDVVEEAEHRHHIKQKPEKVDENDSVDDQVGLYINVICLF